MTEETVEEAAQIVNSKRNFSINPTMAEETAEGAAQRVNAKRLAAKERKTAQLDESQPGQWESKRIKTENDSDDDWVWDFDLDKVINAYQILVKKTKVRRYVFHSDFHKNNNLVLLFKTAIELMPTDTLLSTKWQSLWSVISSLNSSMLRCPTYPIIFWDRANGYHFNIKLINPAIKKEIDTKCSAMKYYAYRLLIHHLLHLHIIHLGIRYNSFYILDNRRFIDMILRSVSFGKSCSPSSPKELWEKYKSQMAENILHRIRLERSDMTLGFTTEIYSCTLVMIEDLCLSIANKLLKHLGMPTLPS